MNESHPILQMRKLSLLKGRHPIHHVILSPNIQGCQWYTPGFAPTSLSTQLDKPSLQVTDPPGPSSSQCSFRNNLSLAAT